MGAGGANVASGGSFSAIFSNPAGLARIPAQYGWEFQALNLSGAFNDDVNDLSDIMDAADESEAALSAVLDDMVGTRIHLGVSAVPFSMAKKFKKYAFGAGVVTSVNSGVAVHQGFGSQGMLEINTLATAGAAFGLAHDINGLKIGRYVLNRLSVGYGAKAMGYGALSKAFSAAELADENFEMDDELKEGASVVADLGMIYNVTPRFTVGASALNIGGIGEGDMEIPMTINAGVAYTYEVEKRVFFKRVRLSADYIDIAQGYEDESFIKRTRLGADLNIWDGWASSFALQTGIYQGEFTAGLSLRLAVLELAVATYAEEMGAYGGQDPDRRTVASFGINW